MTIDLLDLVGLEDRIATQAATLDAATHALLADIRVFDAAGGWSKQGARSCADWLSWRLGWSATTGREHVRVARKLAELPAIDDALRRDELSYCKVRAITRVATAANEALLLEDARLTTGAQLEKICRKYASVLRNEEQQNEQDDRARRYVRRTERDDGMIRIEAVLHPDEAAMVWAALAVVARSLTNAAAPPPTFTASPTAATTSTSDPIAAADGTTSAPAHVPAPDTVAAPQARPPIVMPPVTDPHDMNIAAKFDRANALVAMSESVLRGERPHRAPVELVITTTREALVSPATSPEDLSVTADATCLSAEAARRLACDAGIVEMVVDDDGTPLDVGRRYRTVNAALKRALAQRDGTCRFPGCACTIYLHAHHAEHWATGGDTALHNLVLLCSHHHRFVHEYGYRAEIAADGQPRFFGPNGRPLADVPSRPSLEQPAAASLATRARTLAITSSTNVPHWDGDRVDYDMIVEALLKVDGRF